MSISITDRTGLMSAEDRNLIEERLLLAFSRFESRVDDVQLIATDLNGPRGGVDKSCRISIKLHGAADVMISDKDTSILKCVAKITERAANAVSRAISKTKDVDRSRPVFQDPIAGE